MSPSAQQTERHYRGTVLDAVSRAPVHGVVVTASYLPGGFFTIAPEVAVAHDRSRADGSFDIVVSAGSKRPEIIQAGVDIPPPAAGRWHRGELCSYGALLWSISDRRENIVLIKKSYVE